MKRKKSIVFIIVIAFLCSLNSLYNKQTIINNSSKIYRASNEPLVVTTYTLDNGVKYDAYVPSNVNSDTHIIVYSTPFDDSAYTALSKGIINSKLDAIVIVPRIVWQAPDIYKTNVFNMVNTMKSKYNITTDGYIGNGFSQQAFQAVRTMAYHIQENPNTSRQIILLNDGIPRSDNNGTTTELLNNNDIEMLQKNNTLIIDYCQKDYNGLQVWKNLGTMLLNNSNLDVLYISDSELPYNEFWANHNYIYSNSYASGIYSQVLDFVYNGKSLPSTGYIYRLYNHETNTVEEYSASEIEEKLKASLKDFRKSSGQGNSSDNTTKATRQENTTKKPGDDVPADCNTMLGDPKDKNSVAYVLQNVLTYMKYAGIAILIFITIWEFTKTAASGDADALKKVGQKTAKRLIACILLFFIPILVNMIMEFIGAYGACGIG